MISETVNGLRPKLTNGEYYGFDPIYINAFPMISVWNIVSKRISKTHTFPNRAIRLLRQIIAFREVYNSKLGQSRTLTFSHSGLKFKTSKYRTAHSTRTNIRLTLNSLLTLFSVLFFLLTLKTVCPFEVVTLIMNYILRLVKY